MQPKFDLHQPSTLREATSLLGSQPSDIKLLAGGQSLIAAMKLGLATPTALVDLQAIPELKRLDIVNDGLHIGSMCTHAQLANSELLKAFCPMLAKLAAGIADQQVRNRGTIGGSLANNDPASDWPCGLLAVAAVVHTNQRAIAIDDFLQGIYATALTAGEIITHIIVPASSKTNNAKYLKFEQKASRFALVGVAVAALPSGTPTYTRIAVTGLGLGTCLWQPASIDEPYPEHLATSDLHASAKYRAHLVGVLARRALDQAWEQTPLSLRDIPPTTQGETVQLVPPYAIGGSTRSAGGSTHEKGADANWLAGASTLAMTVERTWSELLNPATLQQCIPGCESFLETSPNHFDATVKIGIGMIAVRFKAHVELTNLITPQTSASPSCTILFSGDAGTLGFAKGEAHIQLTPTDNNTQTTLHWRALPILGGKIATLAGRMVQGLAAQLSAQFFKRFKQVAASPVPSDVPISTFQKIKNWFKKFK